MFRCTYLLRVLAIGALFALAGCGTTEPQVFTNRSQATSISTSTTTGVEVLYEVEGTAKWSDVTMETPTGTKQDSPDVPMVRVADGGRGLRFTFSPGHFLYLSAQNKDGYGSIICRITANGTVISENSSSGGYAIAVCKGVAG